jgi:hypothetical protein
MSNNNPKQTQQIQRIEPSDIQKVAESIEAAVAVCGVNAISKLPAFMQAVQMATGITQLRAALTDAFMLATVMPLQGAKLGFLTDKDRNKDGTRGPGYAIEVVRDCTIEAMLRGFSIVGNEFNIIAGGFYGTKAGWERKVSEYPGLFELQYQAGVPHLVGDNGALVPYVARWTLNGAKMSLECTQTKDVDLRIPVRINAGMGVDAAIGKATRKLMFRIYQRIAGSAFGAVDGEVGDDAAINTTGETAPAPSAVPPGTPEGRRINLNGKAPSQPPPANETQAAASPENDGR